jgi:septal ring factor EnvC (AmiA/AmiB activator)
MEAKTENDPAEFSLKTPVVGKIIPTYESTNPEWGPFTQGVLFTTRSGSHVTSPLCGKIAFAGEYAKDQGKMVIVEAPNSHIVMSGLGSLNCTVGQSVIAGEPVGRMPVIHAKKSKADPQPASRLYLEVWWKENTVNPLSVLKRKEKES